jgi:23S rRNA (guanosine2251-2'-O)-methyltransferase
MSEYAMIWGRRPVLEALRGSLRLQKILLIREARGQIVARILELARKRDIPVEMVEKKVLASIVPRENHQGVLAYLVPYEYFQVGEILQKAQHSNKLPFLLFLDHIQDPHNLGSLLRTASGAGVDGVVIPRDRATGITPAVFKGSAGALAHIPVARVVNLVREIEHLKKEGLWIIGADMDGEHPFYEVDYNFPLALVLGSEGRGLSKLLRKKCDFLVRIPLTGTLSSLNVSVAGAIIIYEIFRQRFIASKS